MLLIANLISAPDRMFVLKYCYLAHFLVPSRFRPGSATCQPASADEWAPRAPRKTKTFLRAPKISRISLCRRAFARERRMPRRLCVLRPVDDSLDPWTAGPARRRPRRSSPRSQNLAHFLCLSRSHRIIRL